MLITSNFPFANVFSCFLKIIYTPFELHLVSLYMPSVLKNLKLF